MLKITSSAFKEGELIPQKYSCKGENINPPLKIENVPKEAKSLVLIMEDPDATKGTFTHWILYNLDPKVTEIHENSTPDGAIEGQNSAGNTPYVGPCPPSGTHRYFFRVFALNGDLTLPGIAGREELDQALDSSVIASGHLMGKFSH